MRVDEVARRASGPLESLFAALAVAPAVYLAWWAVFFGVMKAQLLGGPPTVEELLSGPPPVFSPLVFSPFGLTFNRPVVVVGEVVVCLLGLVVLVALSGAPLFVRCVRGDLGWRVACALLPASFGLMCVSAALAGMVGLDAVPWLWALAPIAFVVSLVVAGGAGRPGAWPWVARAGCAAGYLASVAFWVFIGWPPHNWGPSPDPFFVLAFVITAAMPVFGVASALLVAIVRGLTRRSAAAQQALRADAASE